MAVKAMIAAVAAVTIANLFICGCLTAEEQPVNLRPRVEAATAAVHSAYVISMPQSEGRREVLDPALRKHASQVTYVQPFDGRRQQAQPPGDLPANLNVEGYQYLNITLPESCQDTSAVQMSVALSHLKGTTVLSTFMASQAILEAYTAGEELVLILEDDMHIQRWPTRTLLFTAPPGWDVLELYMMGEEANNIYRAPPSLWVPWNPYIFSAGAYIIHRKAMAYVLDAYLPGATASGSIQRVNLTTMATRSTWPHPLACISEHVLFSMVKTYVCTDFTIMEHSGDSTIDKSHRSMHDTTAALSQAILHEHGFTLHWKD